MEPFPVIVCLCGSTRFKEEFIQANFQETLAGKIVLTVGWFSHHDASTWTPNEEQKIAFDILHKRKIDLADEVLVIDVDGYIGESTRSEILHAEAAGKIIRYRSQELKDANAGN